MLRGTRGGWLTSCKGSPSLPVDNCGVVAGITGKRGTTGSHQTSGEYAFGIHQFPPIQRDVVCYAWCGRRPRLEATTREVLLNVQEMAKGQAQRARRSGWLTERTGSASRTTAQRTATGRDDADCRQAASTLTVDKVSHVGLTVNHQ